MMNLFLPAFYIEKTFINIFRKGMLDNAYRKPYYGYKISYIRVIANENQHHSRGKK